MPKAEIYTKLKEFYWEFKQSSKVLIWLRCCILKLPRHQSSMGNKTHLAIIHSEVCKQ